MWGCCKFTGGRFLVLHGASLVLGTLLVVFFISLPQNASAASRYWVGNGSNTNWNTTDNWATTSGGASGATVPGSGDVAILDGGGGE